MRRETAELEAALFEIAAADAGGEATPDYYRAREKALAILKQRGYFCPRCAGCGKLADTDDREPWKYWLEMPLQNAVAVVMGIVKPIDCDRCNGLGIVRTETT